MGEQTAIERVEMATKLMDAMEAMVMAVMVPLAALCTSADHTERKTQTNIGRHQGQADDAHLFSTIEPQKREP